MPTVNQAVPFRVGQGFDVHAFGPSVSAVSEVMIHLGGIQISSDRPLLAHSDGDVLLHALTDALLGAAALGDIGQHFPDTDPKNAGKDSGQMLQEVVRLVRDRGLAWGNGDLTIVAQKPKIEPHRDLIQARIAQLLSVDVNTVNVKATTTEHLGFTGRAEGIACFATVLLFAVSI